MKNRKWACKDCKTVSEEAALMEAPHPFAFEETILGCPECKSAEGFDLLCDEPGCLSLASCGWPTKDPKDAWGGYRQTCFKHSLWANE